MAENNLDENNNPIPADPGAATPGADDTAAAPKRGRGRPRKVGLSEPPAEPADAGGQPSSDRGAPLWNSENCRPISQLPFLVAGVSTGWDGWALEEKEAVSLADALAPVLNALVPAGGQYAAMVALASTLLVISGMKYKGYREHLAKEKNADAGK